MIEHGVYPSVVTACAAVGWPASALDAYVVNAPVDRSEFVLTNIAIEDPDELLRVVLSLGEGGEVSLWVGFFGETSEDRDAVLAFLAQMRELRASENARWTGRHAVGEWNLAGQHIPQ